MSQKHPISPSKAQPNPKRPNSAQGDPIITRGAIAINPDSVLRTFDDLVLKPIDKFSGTKLPSNAEVLQRIFYVKDNSDPQMNRSNGSIVDEILPELETIYNSVPCAMKRKDTCKAKILNLYEKWRSMTKNDGKKSLSAAVTLRFKDELSSLCDLLAQDVIHQIEVDRSRTQAQRTEDIKFLQDQKSERKASITPIVDKAFVKRQERKEQRSENIKRSTSLTTQISSMTTNGKY